MRRTLLELTQDILSGMSSDEVNSISDSTESMQVANIIKQKYFDIVAQIDLPEQEQLTQLDSAADVTQPVLMYLPENLNEVRWVKYYNSNDNGVPPAPGYCEVFVLPNKEFIEWTSQFNTEETNVESFDFAEDASGMHWTFHYKTDTQPCYCTIINNYFVVFDAYDSTQDSTLQSSKTMVFGKINPAFSMTDDFIVDLGNNEFQLLFNEAKTLAFFELKQQAHQLAMKENKRGWTSAMRKVFETNRPSPFDSLPNYGRTNAGTGAVSYFKQRGFR